MERPGFNSLFILPFAVWLSVLMPGNHLVHHTFWAGVGDVLLVTGLIVLFIVALQTVTVPLLEWCLVTRRGGLAIQVPFWALAVGMYWAIVEHSPSGSYGIASDRFLGVLLGGTVIAVPVLLIWHSIAMHKIVVEAEREALAIRSRYY